MVKTTLRRTVVIQNRRGTVNSFYSSFEACLQLGSRGSANAFFVNRDLKKLRSPVAPATEELTESEFSKSTRS